MPNAKLRTHRINPHHCPSNKMNSSHNKPTNPLRGTGKPSKPQMSTQQEEKQQKSISKSNKTTNVQAESRSQDQDKKNNPSVSQSEGSVTNQPKITHLSTKLIKSRLTSPKWQITSFNNDLTWKKADYSSSTYSKKSLTLSSITLLLKGFSSDWPN